MKLTVDSVMALGPCSRWPRARVQGVFKNRDSMSLAEVLADEFVPTDDAIWLFYKVLEEAKETRQLEWFFCWCVWQAAHLLKDQRTVEALRVTQRQVRGYVSKEKRAGAKKALMATRVGENSAWNAVYAIFWLAESTTKATQLATAIEAALAAADAHTTKGGFLKARTKQRQMAIRIAKRLDRATT